MKKISNFYIIIVILIFKTSIFVYGQNSVKNGEINDSIESKILNEKREVIIYLPLAYNKSEKQLPVLYVLDGSKKVFKKTTSTINRLSLKNESIPKMIVVAIVNKNRPRDMWPTKTKYYSETPGASNFLDFIEEELIPYIEKKYRTSQTRIIYGQSLSAVFTLYAFLTKPYLFNSYIAGSGGFPDCENYFNTLTFEALKKKELFNDKYLFITHGLKDPLDQEGIIHQQMIDFTEIINSKLGEEIFVEYKFYKNGKHIPKNSLSDGLTTIYKSGKN